jgi:ParB family chromosome partitioning protein
VINALLQPAPPAKAKARAVDPNDADFEARLRERYGTAVALKRGSRGGSIEIKYNTEQDLLRIADLLLDQ